MAKSPQNQAPFDVTAVQIGDSVVLSDGSASPVEGVQISEVLGNAVLIGDRWVDFGTVSPAAS